MRFDEDSRLDTSQVSDTRRSRMPGGRVAVGGGASAVALIIALLLGVNPFEGGGGLAGVDQVQSDNTEIAQACRTGADANQRDDCRVVAIVNSVQEYWEGALGDRYSTAQTRLFSRGTQGGCGFASSDVGPFYCPTDQTVFLDLSFWQELRSRFGATAGPFAQAYVIAHEYGHHVQNLLGTMDRVGGDRQGPQSGAVRLELQADCYAGVWANHATSTPGPDGGDPLVARLTEADIADGLDAAAAVGDDRIQERAQGRVNPEAWTHGSAAQRQRWFTVGYSSGEPAGCDTFSGPI